MRISLRVNRNYSNGKRDIIFQATDRCTGGADGSAGRRKGRRRVQMQHVQGERLRGDTVRHER